MIGALNNSVQGMQQASDRFEDLAANIAYPQSEALNNTSVQTEEPLKAEEPTAPVSETNETAKQWLEMKETELAFQSSAVTTEAVVQSSEDLLEALQ